MYKMISVRAASGTELASPRGLLRTVGILPVEKTLPYQQTSLYAEVLKISLDIEKIRVER